MGVDWDLQRLCFFFNRKQRWTLVGRTGESSRFHLMRSTGCCSPLQSISCRPALGDHPQTPHYSPEGSSYLWLCFFKPVVHGKALIPHRTRKGLLCWCTSAGPALRPWGSLLLVPPDGTNRAPQKVVPGAMCGGPGLFIMTHVYRWGNRDLKGRVLRPRAVLNQKPDGGELAMSLTWDVGTRSPAAKVWDDNS